MKKIVFSTFENTLIDEEEAIDIKTIIEIDKFRKKGNIFAIVSDNVLNYSLEYNRDFPFIDYIIALDGSVIYDVNKKKVIYKKNIPLTNVKKIVTLSDNINLYNIGNKFDKKYFLDNFDSLKNEIYKIEIKFSDVPEKDLLINNLVKLNVNININDNNKCIEVLSRNVNRLNSIKKVVGKKYKNVFVVLGIDKDVELANSYESYAVGNASKNVKKCSKYKLDENNTFGVLEFLKKIDT